MYELDWLKRKAFNRVGKGDLTCYFVQYHALALTSVEGFEWVVKDLKKAFGPVKRLLKGLNVLLKRLKAGNMD
jgi:hypothetical protein